MSIPVVKGGEVVTFATSFLRRQKNLQNGQQLSSFGSFMQILSTNLIKATTLPKSV